MKIDVYTISFHFISDHDAVYTTSFSFVIGLLFIRERFAVHCDGFTSLYGLMKGTLLDLIMRLHIGLMSDSTVYAISDWFHATFRRYEAYRIIAL